MADIDLGEVAEKEIAKRDRKIERLTEQLAAKEAERAQLHQTLVTLAALKTAVLQAADYLDPFRYDDF